MTAPEVAWHELVLWRRSILGKLHAQWVDEAHTSSAACSEGVVLSGPVVPYTRDGCVSCARLAKSLLSSAESERLVTYGGQVEVLRELAESRVGPMSLADVRARLECGPGAAQQAIVRAMRAGVLQRVGVGLYEVAP